MSYSPPGQNDSVDLSVSYNEKAPNQDRKTWVLALALKSTTNMTLDKSLKFSKFVSLSLK